MSTSQHYDVLVAGAGPAGVAAAAGFARRGASVLLVEANPKASFRFAGEWIHPAGAAALAKLELTPHGITAGHLACEGFAVFPDDGSDPIRLEYTDRQLGFTCEHGELVTGLRAQASEIPGLEYVEGVRVTKIDGHNVTLQRKGEAEVVVHAKRIVGADGRSSVVRKSLYGATKADIVSYMAGLELEDVELPFEGFGHVLLGGPGPVLLYRIAPGRVRACIDVPVDYPGSRRDARYLWEAFGDRFPVSLRGAFRRALETQRLIWACNRFSPRAAYGEGHVALVGDAVGFYHPLTASGITIGLKDAAALVESDDAASYAAKREPRSYTPELLANALHHVFNRDDEAAVAIRDSMYSTWRNSRAERDRTMRILGGDELRLGQFGAAFVRVAAGAAAGQITSGKAHKLGTFMEFAQWPAASLLPTALRQRVRDKSSAAHPLAGLRIRPAAPERGRAPAPASVDVDVDALIARVRESSDVLDEETRLRRSIGGPALSETVALAQSVARRVAAQVASKADLDLEATSKSVLVLSEVASELPGLRASLLQSALIPLRERLEREQEASGAFGDLRRTALAAECLVTAGMPVFHPRIRRAFRHVATAQQDTGRIGDLRTTTLVARAILRTGAPYVDAAAACLVSLSSEDSLDELAGEALRLYRDMRTSRLQAPGKQRAGRASAADHAYCHDALLAVSRSFARPIEMLPGDLRSAVMCGYLLCRIADTIEDNAFFSMAERDERYHVFLGALQASPESAEVKRFERLFEGVRGDETEADLARHLSVVMRVYRSIPSEMQRKATRWIEEMVRGMQLYSHRGNEADGFNAMHTVEDLERYCFFVAGTVGHMLTDLFVEEFGRESASLELDLRKNAEAFGLGLQLVNILKDVTDDRTRHVSYVPRTSCAAAGLTIQNLVDDGNRDAAHAAVAPLFDRAQEHLDRALEYTLTIPKEQTSVRLFCLLPLWMAVRTLVHGRGNDAMFVAGAPVKIARDEVERLIGECMARVGDDAALRAHYDQLWKLPAQEHVRSASAN